MFEQLDPNIRIAVRALIIRDGQLLVQHKLYEDGSQRYVLPGGAPEPGESLAAGLDRECREEIGTGVEVGELLHVAELFRPRSNNPGVTRHQLEMVFRCQVPADYQPVNGPEPDKHQVDVTWLSCAEPHPNFWPPGLIDVAFGDTPPSSVYLGQIKAPARVLPDPGK